MVRAHVSPRRDAGSILPGCRNEKILINSVGLSASGRYVYPGPLVSPVVSCPKTSTYGVEAIQQSLCRSPWRRIQARSIWMTIVKSLLAEAPSVAVKVDQGSGDWGAFLKLVSHYQSFPFTSSSKYRIQSSLLLPSNPSPDREKDRGRSESGGGILIPLISEAGPASFYLSSPTRETEAGSRRGSRSKLATSVTTHTHEISDLRLPPAAISAISRRPYRRFLGNSKHPGDPTSDVLYWCDLDAREFQASDVLYVEPEDASLPAPYQTYVVRLLWLHRLLLGAWDSIQTRWCSNETTLFCETWGRDPSHSFWGTNY
ncbi:hypothetical protein LXL04_002938 [Taraxacum kok-saghyz]